MKKHFEFLKISNICMIIFELLIPIISSAQPQYKTGSGNGITLTETGQLSTSPYINAGSGFDFGTNAFTVESWVKRDSIKTTLRNYGRSTIQGTASNSWGIGFLNNNTLFFTRVDVNYVSSTGTIADTNWHHIAVVYTGTQVLFYIDGVLSGSPSYSYNFNNTSGNYLIGPRINSGNSNGDQTLDGRIDEMRIWNVALTQNEIRNRMCHKINTSDSLYSNLVLYYNFDESSGSTAFDASPQGRNGTFFNNPTRVISGAAIGDTSVYTYGGTSVGLADNDGENITVSNISGSPAGIHLYLVGSVPNSTKGVSGLGSNNKYFGVFPFGNSSIGYTITYKYAGNSSVSPSNEGSLALYMRKNNSFDTWINTLAILDRTNNILVTSEDNTGEYILGSTGVSLPLKILSFTAQLSSDNTLLNWQTANEINTSYFNIQRSGDGVHFNIINKIVSSGNSNNTNNYTYTDVRVTELGSSKLYYRLQEVDKDGKDNYSNVQTINLTKSNSRFYVSPNPTKDFINIISSVDINNAQVRIIDMNGKTLYATEQNLIAGQQLKIGLSKFSSSVLIVIIETKNERKQFEIVKE